MRNIIFIIVIAVSIYAFIQWEKLTEIYYKINNKLTKIIYATLGEVNLDLALTVGNPTDFNATITGYDMDIIINGRKAGSIKGNKSQPVKRKSESTIYLNVTFSPNQIFADNKDQLVNMLNDLNGIGIVLSGVVCIESGFIKKSINVNEKFNINDFKRTK